jgi:hypothetical protein
MGSTVRKPVVAATPAVEALLDHLAGVGFRGAPRTLGLDEIGRHVLEYVPGSLADVLPPMSGPAADDIEEHVDIWTAALLA